MKLSAIRALALCAPMLGISLAAEAQQPQRTQLTFGEWTVRCQIQPSSQPPKVCDVVHIIGGQPPGQPQTRNQPTQVMQVLLARRDRRQQTRLVIQVQANVLIESGVNLFYDDRQPPIVVPYSRCFPTACFASGPVSDDMIKKLRGAAQAGRVEFTDGAERKVSVPISFNGFPTAYDAWLKE